MSRNSGGRAAASDGIKRRVGSNLRVLIFPILAAPATRARGDGAKHEADETPKRRFCERPKLEIFVSTDIGGEDAFMLSGTEQR